MADMNKNEDRTRVTRSRSRPRPEVKRPNIPPGGLPLPPSRQESVPSSSRALPGSGTTSSNIPPDIVPSSSDNSLSGPMPTDPFGLPDFTFSIASTSETEFGLSSGTGFSSIKSPTHLPRLANIKVPNVFGSHPARSRSIGPSLPSSIQLPRPPNARSSRDRKTRDLPGMSASTEKDFPKRAKRPTDLPLSDVTSTDLSNDPGPNDIPGPSSSNLPSSRTSKESHKDSNTERKSDRASKSKFPNAHMPGNSADDDNPESRNLPGTSTMNETSTSATIHLHGSSSNAKSSDHHNPQGKLDVKRSSDPMPIGIAGPSGIPRTSDSMPSIAQHSDSQPLSKSKSVLGKFKRFVRKGLGVRKTKGGPEDEEESTGLVFERDEDGQEPRTPPRPREPEKKYKKFPNVPYNPDLDRDNVLPSKEVMEKCYVCENTPEGGSPTESNVSNTSTTQSQQDPVSIDNPATSEPISSNPTSTATEQKCTCNSASKTPEQSSASNSVAETPSASNPIAGISESATASNSIAEISQSSSASNHIAGISEFSSANDPKAEAQKPIFKK